ncbi:MAG: sigW 8 [Phycisphaerales bacterium]|nr:sigW 8 [Phycisphaerales bacterium]MDB5299505.1 sigW 8 [Phycisphaerales bacterium]MDB5304567.1 sigW 8 [Phycisphaerales bacterium]
MAEADLTDIYRRYRQGLFTLALSVTGCPARAEDAVHDAFARLCRKIDPLAGRPDSQAVAYVFAAVRNAAIDQVRRTPRESDDAIAQSLFSQTAGPAQNAIDSERERSIAAAVDALPADQREVVVLRVYAQLTFADVAVVVGAPLATVAARYRRALERLRLRLERVL